MWKWQELGSPRFLGCLFFLHRMPRNIAQNIADNKEKFSQSKTETLLNKKSIPVARNHSNNKKNLVQIYIFSIKNCHLNGGFHQKGNFHLYWKYLPLHVWLCPGIRRCLLGLLRNLHRGLCALCPSGHLVTGCLCCIIGRGCFLGCPRAEHWPLTHQSGEPFFLLLRLWYLHVGVFIIPGIFPAPYMSSGRTVPAHSCIYSFSSIFILTLWVQKSFLQRK